MASISFKLKEGDNFRNLEIENRSLSHCTDTEELSMEIKEHLYNEVAGENGKYETFEEFEDDFDNFVFQSGDYWEGVVEPLFNSLCSCYSEDYDGEGDYDGEENWERDDWW